MRCLTALVLAALIVASAAPAGDVIPPPASTAASLDDGTRAAILEALDDERLAKATYAAVIATYGERRPFSNIIHAEARHEAALLGLLRAHAIEAPEDRWADATIAVPETFPAACEAAARAEIVNVAMYDRLLEQVKTGDAHTVMVRLRDASQSRHLPAFRRHAADWTIVDPEGLSATQVAQRDRAVGARDAMFESLLARLAAELQEGGPAGAIAVCREAAPRIARETGAEHAVRIGRTSWRLRNSRNAPPIWAQEILADRPEAPRYAASDDGRFGTIMPIRIATPCLACHGSETSIAPDVRRQLAEHYPDDRATGFAEGDLRGWFWVEVPGSGEARGAETGAGRGGGRGRGRGGGGRGRGG